MVHTDDSRMTFTKSCAKEAENKVNPLTPRELMISHGASKQVQSYRYTPRGYGAAAESMPARKKKGIRFGLAMKRLCCGASIATMSGEASEGVQSLRSRSKERSSSKQTC